MSSKVSIIIPCYGVERYLNRCMETIVNQSLQDIEIILVDDKSPDRVPQMCDDWAKKDPRIKVIHKEVNEGLGLARNTGLEVATGEYIAFVDSDDFVDKDMYNILYSKAKEKEYDVVYCNCIEYYNEHRQIHKLDLRKETIFMGRQEVDEFLLDMVGPEPEFPRSVKYRGSVWHSIYKHSLFKEYNVQFVSERKYISEDLVFDIDYLSHCKSVVWIPNALYYHCYNGESLSHTVKDEKYELRKKFIVDINSRLSQLYPASRYYIHLQRYCIFIFLVNLKKAVNNKYQKITANNILQDNFWKEYTKNYPVKRLSFKYRVALYLYEKTILWPILKFFLK